MGEVIGLRNALNEKVKMADSSKRKKKREVNMQMRQKLVEMVDILKDEDLDKNDRKFYIVSCIPRCLQLCNCLSFVHPFPLIPF